MGFQIGYRKLLTLRCWHPTYLGRMAGKVPHDGSALTVAERQDYLRYDLRNLLDIFPTAAGAATLQRFNLRWVPSTLGGWLLAKDTFTPVDSGLRLQLGVALRDPGFAAATDFGISSRQGKLFYLSNAGAAPAPQHDLTDGDLRAIHFENSQARQVRLSQLAPGTDGQVQLRDPLLAGNPVLRTLPVGGGAATTDHYLLELSTVAAGLYRFTGTNINNQNLVVGMTDRPELLGVIDLQLAGWVAAACDLHFKPSSNP